MIVRLTRNLDKDRGYVNGAVGVVRKVLSYSEGIPTVFTVELSNGVLVLVHPIYDMKQCFLPCTYGYATTIRRAQGATYWHGCLWFNHSHPPERGYGYVGASRFKSKDGIHLFGKIRRTDWLPVRPISDYDLDDTIRGEESMTDYNSSMDEAEVQTSMRRHRSWVRRGERLDDYRTDSEDSGSDASYEGDAHYEYDADHMAADYADMEAWQEKLRANHQQPGYVPLTSIADLY